MVSHTLVKDVLMELRDGTEYYTVKAGGKVVQKKTLIYETGWEASFLLKFK